MHKGDWTMEFVITMLELRPDMGQRLALTIALQEWVQGSNEKPAEVAKRWVAARPPPPVEKPR